MTSYLVPCRSGKEERSRQEVQYGWLVLPVSVSRLEDVTNMEGGQKERGGGRRDKSINRARMFLNQIELGFHMDE